jgi:octaprenyl-diphosphate synthase
LAKPFKLEVSFIINQYNKKLDFIIKEDLLILKEIKKKVIESGGKRIRPLTHYFFSQLLHYEGTEWLDVGTIAELIHAASLLHDDVIDGAEVRRGKPTIGKLYGNKTAILAGDFLLACGIDHLNKLNNPALMKIFTTVIRDLSVGELIQMQWERNPKITMLEYNKIIFGKTASLFGAVCETAAVLAKAESKQTERLRKFGIDMGIMFQIKDDYIDYFQSSENSGKVQMKDFLNGLFTYPIIILKEKCSKLELKEIVEVFSKSKRSLLDISRIQELLYKYEIKKFCLNELVNLSSSLIETLQSFDEGEIRKNMILKIEELVGE